MFSSAPENVETYRKPRSTYLLIDSADRIQTSGNDYNFEDIIYTVGNALQPINNFTIQKRQTFVSGYFHRIGVVEARFEFNSPNVNPRNNQITFIDSASVEHTITVPEDFYTPDELATKLDELLTAEIPGQTWAVTYPLNGYFKIVSDENFQIQPHNYGSAIGTMKGLFYMMGFSQVNNLTPATTQVGSIFPSMCYTRYIDICSRQLTQYQKAKDNSTRENQVPAVLCRLYLSNYTSEGIGIGDDTARQIWPGCGPAVIYRYFNVPKMSNWSPGAFVDQIDIELRDDAGNLLYIPGPYTAEDPEGELQNAILCQNNFQLTLHLSES